MCVCVQLNHPDSTEYSPSISIIYRFRKVPKTASGVHTDLMKVSLCWSANNVKESKGERHLWVCLYFVGQAQNILYIYIYIYIYIIKKYIKIWKKKSITLNDVSILDILSSLCTWSTILASSTFTSKFLSYLSIYLSVYCPLSLSIYICTKIHIDNLFHQFLSSLLPSLFS